MVIKRIKNGYVIKIVDLGSPLVDFLKIAENRVCMIIVNWNRFFWGLIIQTRPLYGIIITRKRRKVIIFSNELLDSLLLLFPLDN